MDNNEIIDHAKKYGDAIAVGDHKTANKHNIHLMKLYAGIKKSGKLSQFKELAFHPDENVRLWSATFLLNYDPQCAKETLITLTKSPGIVSLTASTTLELWEKGLLNL